jgi:hypothetical protein
VLPPAWRVCPSRAVVLSGQSCLGGSSPHPYVCLSPNTELRERVYCRESARGHLPQEELNQAYVQLERGEDPEDGERLADDAHGHDEHFRGAS